MARVLFNATRSAIRLSRRFRSAHAFVVKPRPVEAANASLSGREHGAGIFDPSRARLWLLGELIQWIQSRRALGVMSDHKARAFDAAAARAFLKIGRYRRVPLPPARSRA